MAIVIMSMLSPGKLRAQIISRARRARDTCVQEVESVYLEAYNVRLPDYG